MRRVLLGDRASSARACSASCSCRSSSWRWSLLLGLVLTFAPRLHNVPHNPLEAMIQTPRDAIIFAIVVMIAGGVREEVQRGFIVHRFDQYLGGAGMGVAVYSVAFGLGHVEQGCDAAIATGLLGVIWGCRLPRPAQHRRADGQPRRLQPAAARQVRRACGEIQRRSVLTSLRLFALSRRELRALVAVFVAVASGRHRRASIRRTRSSTSRICDRSGSTTTCRSRTSTSTSTIATSRARKASTRRSSRHQTEAGRRPNFGTIGCALLWARSTPSAT